MKIRLCFVLLVLLLLLVLTACTGTGTGNAQSPDAPYIGENGNWWIGSNDLGVAAQGPKGDPGEPGAAVRVDGIPYLGENGNWWIGENDLGVAAQGPKGDPGATGAKGEPGTSVGVVLVSKTATVNNVDTYTILFSDGTTASFTVTNGLNGSGSGSYITSISKVGSTGLVDTYQILLSDGRTYPFEVKNGEGGQAVSISSVEQLEHDTYQVTLSNGEKTVFTVSNTSVPTLPTVVSVKLVGTDDTDADWSYYSLSLSDGTSLIIHVYTRYITIDENAICYRNGEKWFSLNDRKPIQDGITFSISSYNGTVGLVVTGVQEQEVLDFYSLCVIYFENDFLAFFFPTIIPDYVGTLPVIGVAESAFSGSNRICSVILSKNTQYIGANAFKNCSHLTSVDFNGAKLERINNYAFAGTNLTELNLPETVTEIGSGAFQSTKLTSVTLPEKTTELGSECFDQVMLSEINLDRVTYFGSNCLTGLVRGYVYLSDQVEYVGSNAFPTSFIYLEKSEYPSNWASNIGGEKYEYTYGCRQSGDYIYSVTESEATVYYYTGSEKKISIPSKIDGYTVTAIGYGFNSLKSSTLSLLENAKLLQSATQTDAYYLDEVRIPNTVKTIGYYTFQSSGTMIIIPASVEKMWKDVGYFDYSAYGRHCSFLSFACSSSSVPLFVGYGSNSNGFYESITISFNDWKDYSSKRYCFEIDPAKVTLASDSRTYYYAVNENEYALLAVLDVPDEPNYTVKATFNGKPVTTICPFAVSGLTNTKTITIENGVRKIKGYAFDNLDLLAVLIPASVEIINANGFDNVCKDFYCGVAAKPDEWDSQWAGGNTSSYSITYSATSLPDYRENDTYKYAVMPDDTVALFQWKGSGTKISIPRTIDGYPVKAIRANCFTISSYDTVNIYIPNNVERIEPSAFYSSTSYYRYYYYEASSRPGGASTNIYSGSGYKTEYFNQTLSY